MRDKLYLASYDIKSVNLSSPHVYMLYTVLDFVWLAAFPVNHIYNQAGAGVPYLKYMIPTDVLYDWLDYQTSLKVAYCLVAFIVGVFLTLGLLVGTRSRQRLTTESSQRKVINKAVGVVLGVTYFLLFVPITTFSTPFLLCSKEIQKTGFICYESEHLTIFCFIVLSLVLHLFLIMY